ncbi:hypothetical protein G5I_10446 [Acromyrmex echinatior]|uniref:Tetratricopeptide repeat protein 29 n=1 Tax=Acromyrmex echinatior TaxID=103372 RepID=F4WX77_ACREC|nr:hypothetical protein G5I_10446 [Acromyrmex echinatior]
MKGQLKNVQRHDVGIFTRQIGKGFPEELSKANPKIAEATTIKTVARTRLKMGKVKDELKAMLPILTPSEVRRFHLLPHEAIIDELEEGNYEESIRYLKELFELNEEIHRKTTTPIWDLKKNKNALSRLRDGLIIVEQAKNAGDYISAAAEFLNMALSFQATWEWWWMTERLYRSALENAEFLTSVAGHYEYIANVLYELGMNQLRLRDVEVAFQNLSKFLAMIKRISDPEGICNAHMELNDDINTEKYLQLLMESAVESGLTRKVAQAHYCIGEHFLNKRRPDIATFHLEKSFELYNKLGLCNDADKARVFAGVSKG